MRIIVKPGTPIEPECIAPKPDHADGPLVEYLVGRFGHGDDAPRHARFIAGLIADYHRERGFLIVSEQGFDEVLREKRRLEDKVGWLGDQLAKGDKIAARNAEQYHADAALLRKELADANKRADSMGAYAGSLADEVAALKASLKTATEERDALQRRWDALQHALEVMPL